MRLGDRYLLVLGVLAIVGATAWAIAGGPADAVTTLLVIGLVIALADVVVWVAVEQRPGTLVVPDELAAATRGGARLPRPAWWWPALAVGLFAAAGGLAADQLWFAAVGAAVVFAAVVVLATTRRARVDDPPGRRVVRDARNIQRFLAAHPGPAPSAGGPTARGFIVDLGRRGAKLVIVAGDGEFGDLVAASPDHARLAAELAGLQLDDPTSSSAGRTMRTGPAVWEGMARGRVQA